MPMAAASMMGMPNMMMMPPPGSAMMMPQQAMSMGMGMGMGENIYDATINAPNPHIYAQL